MGGAALRRNDFEAKDDGLATTSPSHQPILDLDSFNSFIDRYEMLRNAGVSIEDIHDCLRQDIEMATKELRISIEFHDNGSLYLNERDQRTPSSSKFESIEHPISVLSPSLDEELLMANMLSKYKKMTPSSKVSKVVQNGKSDVGESEVSINRPCVLIIDDSTTSHRVTSKILKECGYDTMGCMSAEEGLDTLRKNPGKFAFILLDIDMPDIDGIGCLKAIKDDDTIKQNIVIMLTALDDACLNSACKAFGAAKVLLKPLRSNDVTRVVLCKPVDDDIRIKSRRMNWGSQATTECSSSYGSDHDYSVHADADSVYSLYC